MRERGPLVPKEVVLAFLAIAAACDNSVSQIRACGEICHLGVKKVTMGNCECVQLVDACGAIQAPAKPPPEEK